MTDRIKLSWRKEDTPKELYSLLETLGEEYSISQGGRGLKLRFARLSEDEGTVSRVIRARGEVVVEYNNIAAAARGIGSALAGISGEERTPFTSLGIMLDVSRNMVMKIDHFKMWLRRLALCGCNLAMLYTEDTYEIESEPFFGLFRGAYSVEELQELDEYASQLGIELRGCVQMLGHLEQVLKWAAFANIRDTERVMLVDEPAVYELIDKMLQFWNTALKSRNIHIGFDETQTLGRGAYMNNGGREEQTVLFNRHLAAVNQLCRKYGYENPMIWSDMYFRLANPQRKYYDLESPIPDSVRNTIPENVRLVYWDYYNTDAETYSAMIKRHRDLGFDPVMASGIQTWAHLWYDHEQTVTTVIPCLEACRREKVQEVFFTMWGDDGAYCNYDSSLAGIVFAADASFGCVDEEITARRFEAVCSADYETQIAAGYIDEYIEDDKGISHKINGAMLLWDDPLLGIVYSACRRFDPDFDLKLLDRYEEMICRIMPALEDKAAGDIEHAVNILHLLIKKIELRGALEAAYNTGDRLALREIAVNTIPAVIASVWEFDSSFRKQWMDCAKPFGLEIIQQRNATLALRLEETALRIREYLEGAVDSIDELDEHFPAFSTEFPPDPMKFYRRIFTACTPILF